MIFVIFVKMNEGVEGTQDELGPLAGLVPRLARDLFEMAEDAEKMDGSKITIEASFVEIYCGKLYDCLNKRGEQVKMKAVKKVNGRKSSSGFSEDEEVPKIQGHTKRLCRNGDDLIAVFVEGVKTKTIAETNANPVSSRGHSVFDIRVTQEKGEMNTVTSLFRICDLAGSEMSESTGEKLERRQEAKFINTSLTFLGAVVMGLSKGDKFITYRSNLLTQVLEESLGGNSKTLLIVTSSPMEKDCKTTLKSLRFASTANQVRRSIVKNEGISKKQLEAQVSRKEAELRKKDEEVRALKELADDALMMKETIQRLKTKLTNNHKDTEERVNRLKQEHEEAQAQLTKKQAEQLAALRAQMEQARIALEASKTKTMEEFQARIDALEAKLASEQDAEKKQGIIEELQREFNKANSAHENLTQQLADMKTSHERQLEYMRRTGRKSRAGWNDSDFSGTDGGNFSESEPRLGPRRPKHMVAPSPPAPLPAARFPFSVFCPLVLSCSLAFLLISCGSLAASFAANIGHKAVHPDLVHRLRQHQ